MQGWLLILTRILSIFTLKKNANIIHLYEEAAFYSHHKKMYKKLSSVHSLSVVTVMVACKLLLPQRKGSEW